MFKCTDDTTYTYPYQILRSTRTVIPFQYFRKCGRAGWKDSMTRSTGELTSFSPQNPDNRLKYLIDAITVKRNTFHAAGVGRQKGKQNVTKTFLNKIKT